MLLMSVILFKYMYVVATRNKYIHAALPGHHSPWATCMQAKVLVEHNHVMPSGTLYVYAKHKAYTIIPCSYKQDTFYSSDTYKCHMNWMLICLSFYICVKWPQRYCHMRHHMFGNELDANGDINGLQWSCVQCQTKHCLNGRAEPLYS